MTDKWVCLQLAGLLLRPAGSPAWLVFGWLVMCRLSPPLSVVSRHRDEYGTVHPYAQVTQPVSFTLRRHHLLSLGFSPQRLFLLTVSLVVGMEWLVEGLSSLSY